MPEPELSNLELEKQRARQKLLSLPPEVAQEKIGLVLFPILWQVDHKAMNPEDWLFPDEMDT